MAFVSIPQDGLQSTIINTQQITYLREDNYGTAIHFSSGEHIICTAELTSLADTLQLGTSPEDLLITKVPVAR